jgi:site-specific recombinase XerD
MCERGKRPRTVRSAFNPIRGLGEYLVQQGVLTENPSLKVTMPKKDAAIRRVVTDEEVTQLLEACERQRSDKQVALSRALLSVLVYGGLRRQELLDLHLSDVNLEEGSILVRSGKGSKSRKVFVYRECRDAVREWLNFRPAQTDHDYLWAYDRTRRISEDGLREVVETVKAIAGLRSHKDIVPHSLRHNCATRLMKNGADVRSIQAFLGHSSINTTQMYLHVSEEQLRGIADLGALSSPGRPQSGRFETQSGWREPIMRHDDRRQDRRTRIERDRRSTR